MRSNGMQRLTASLNHRRVSYLDYLQSDHWADLKHRFRSSGLCRRRCYACGVKDKPLDIHHKSYNRLWSEKLHDLIELCRECHNAIHDALRSFDDMHLWTASRVLRKKGSVRRFMSWCEQHRPRRNQLKPLSAEHSAGQ